MAEWLEFRIRRTFFFAPFARPGLQEFERKYGQDMKTGFVYVMASATRTIYVGVTSNLGRRVWELKTHYLDGFTKKHNVTNLVYIAEFPRMDDAIAWEKAVKGKTRGKKIALIEEQNPRWNDLAWNWFEDAVHPSTASPSASHGDSAPLDRLRLQNDDTRGSLRLSLRISRTHHQMRALRAVIVPIVVERKAPTMVLKR